MGGEVRRGAVRREAVGRVTWDLDFCLEQNESLLEFQQGGTRSDSDFKAITLVAELKTNSRGARVGAGGMKAEPEMLVAWARVAAVSEGGEKWLVAFWRWSHQGLLADQMESA